MSMPSSPRLPSPPPPAEIQIGPKSPSMGPNAHQAQHMEQTQIDTAAKRRIHPGTKSSEMAAGPPLVPLNELDSAFQLQEHLASLHYHHTRSNTIALTRETAKLLATPPPSIDRTLWLYELCRFLIAQCNSLIVGFLFDTPPCSAATCPEMRASEWQFLCAVHDAPKSCCAIDYSCHTLDWAANVVTNPKIFPSRFVAPVQSESGHDKGAALKNLVNVFRRLHRIFAHAWFQHRGVFWSVEAQTGLYVFFKTVCDLYELLPAENYKLPPEAEGLETTPAPVAAAPAADAADKKHLPASAAGHHQVVTAIARPPSAIQRTGEAQDEDGSNNPARGTNTRRHIRSNPSTGNAVSTVPEVDEDDNHAGGITNRFKDMSLKSPSPPPAVPEAPTSGSAAERPESEDVAEVPVIVVDDGSAPLLNRNTEPELTVTETTAPESEKQTADEPEKEKEQEEAPSEAEPHTVVTEAELEKPVTLVSTTTEPEESTSGPTEPYPDKPANSEDDEAGNDDLILSPDDDEQPTSFEPEPQEKSHAPKEEEELEVPMSAIHSKDFSEAMAKDDAAAAATLAVSEEPDVSQSPKQAVEEKDEVPDEVPAEPKEEDKKAEAETSGDAGKD